MGDIVKFTEATVDELGLKAQGRSHPARQPRSLPGVRPRHQREPQGYSCWSREDPGCGFVIWKSKAGKQLPIAVAKEVIKTGEPSGPVTGFKGRSGKSFGRGWRSCRPRRASGASSSTSRGPRAPSHQKPKRALPPPRTSDGAAEPPRRPPPPDHGRVAPARLPFVAGTNGGHRGVGSSRRGRASP